MKESVLKIKSELFADRIVKLFKYLQTNHSEFVLSKQILRSGTSIGANVSEAAFAASKKDFLAKMMIATKEYNETVFWLQRLKNANYLSDEQFRSIHDDCLELGRLLMATTRTTKASMTPDQ